MKQKDSPGKSRASSRGSTRSSVREDAESAKRQSAIDQNSADPPQMADGYA